MTRAATIAIVIARLTAAAFFLLTAIYALLFYLPFSYQQFILPDVLPGVTTFVAWHHVLFWGVLAALAAASIGDLRNAATRLQTAVFLNAGALAAIYLTAKPLLPGLGSDRSSLVVCYTDYYYDLTGDPAGSQNLVTPALRREYQQLIREAIDEVNRFYRP